MIPQPLAHPEDRPCILAAEATPRILSFSPRRRAKPSGQAPELRQRTLKCKVFGLRQRSQTSQMSPRENRQVGRGRSPPRSRSFAQECVIVLW